MNLNRKQATNVGLIFLLLNILIITFNEVFEGLGNSTLNLVSTQIQRLFLTLKLALKSLLRSINVRARYRTC